MSYQLISLIAPMNRWMLVREALEEWLQFCKAPQEKLDEVKAFLRILPPHILKLGENKDGTKKDTNSK